jgi:hypothetical protein
MDERPRSSSKRCKKRRKTTTGDSFVHLTEMNVNESCNSYCSENEFYINESDCKQYFKDNDLLHKNNIEEVDVVEYLESRKTNNSNLDSLEINSNEEDCIIINHKDNSFMINNRLVNSKNITISKYISNGCYGVIFVSSSVDGIIYVIKLIIYNVNNQNEINTMKHIKKNNNNNIPNFINMAYYHLNCKTITNIQDNKLSKGITTCLKEKKYTMLILEYFDGDFNSILKSHRSDNEILKCIFSQILLSIS